MNKKKTYKYMMIGKFPKLASGKCVKLLYPRLL